MKKLSIKILSGSLLGFCLSLNSCLQGPWDYYPENPPVHKGLWVTGYMVAENPVTDFCIERLLAITEEYTNAFNFYESATVEITGDFGGVRTITLQPHSEKRNCFVGAATDLPQRGQTYNLQASVTWDSSGRTVTTNITGQATIPQQFAVKDTAWMPALAEIGVNISLDSNGLTNIGEAFSKLPIAAQNEFADAYGDTLAQLGNDPEALLAFFQSEQENITDILNKYQVILENDSSAFYLTNVFNTQSHLFSGVYSDDVGAVLITHQFDTNGYKPETAFDNLFGLTPDTANFYVPGNIRRLILYPKFRLDENRTTLDSMGVINTWYFSGWNHLYFYGIEEAYANYIETAVGEEASSMVKPKYNVQGAVGIFVGAIKDTFNVFIKTDSVTITYPLFEARALDCKDKGWEVHEGCRSFYPRYCDSLQRNAEWDDPDCALDYLHRGIEKGYSVNLDSLQDTLSLEDDDFTELQRRANTRYCIENNFPDSTFDCGNILNECNGPDRIYDCKQKLWNFCLDKKWNSNGDHPQCDLGLVSYCLDRPRTSELLCQNADLFCASNAQTNLCVEASQN